MSVVQRVLSPLVDLRREETLTALLLFAYSFLAMTVWNIIKPLTRSQFIRDLGADNLPYVLLVAGLVIGVLMAGYTWLLARLPRRWGLPIVQAGLAGVLVAFWALFRTEAAWVSVVFYVLGLILGLLLISQFWTVANLVYNARQAKRLFGFIGGGAPLGGMAGSALAAVGATRIGSANLLLPSAVLMLAAAVVAAWIIHREGIQAHPSSTRANDESAVGAGEAISLLRQSPHLRLIALVISFAAISAALIEQQLNMAAEVHLGAESTDAITSLLGWIGLGMSAIGLVIQLWLTSRVHRYLGIGFALMVLPVSLGVTALIMLFNAVLWAPAMARMLDQSLRYTLDKTSREVLFLPLPDALKLRAKPFVDVTVDRAARAGAALLLIVLVQPWALDLDWQGISYASLVMVGLWIVTSIRARRGYVRAFRRSIERQDLAADDVRLSGADLTTVETLVQELAHVDPHRVVYAIDILESLGKRQLVSPLLLHHAAPVVRERALQALSAAQDGVVDEWLPQIRRLLADPEARVRAAAVQAVGIISNQAAAALARALTGERDARLRATAATVLARSTSPDDVALAETTLLDLSRHTGDHGRTARLEAALAIGEIDQPRFRPLLLPLLYDPATEVAEAALRSLQAMQERDVLVVPTVVTLLRDRRLREQARDVLVAFGDLVVAPLAYFLHDEDEDLRVRRQIPDTLSRIPAQASVDALVGALAHPDGLLRFEAIVGLERLRRTGAALVIPRDRIEARAVDEATQYFRGLVLDDVLGQPQGLSSGSLPRLALTQKMARARQRIYRLLSLIYPWRDVGDAQWALEHGSAQERSSASEFLDNVLSGELRKRLMPVLEDLPDDEKARRARELADIDATTPDAALLALSGDDDPVLAATAIDAVRQTGRWHLLDALPQGAQRVRRPPCVEQALAWAEAARHGEAGTPPTVPWPIVAVVDRLHALPLFGVVSVSELFDLARTCRQVQHASGAVMATRGERPAFVHVLLDGRVVAEGGAVPRTVEAPAALGVLEALQGSPPPETLRADTGALTLTLTAEEFRAALGAHADLVSGLFAMAVDQATARRHAITPCDAPDACAALAADGLHGAETLLLLEHVPLFAALSPAEAQHVAGIARTVALRAGTSLFAADAPPDLWIILSGSVVLDGHDEVGASETAGPGSVVGALATLSGRPLGRAATTACDGTALRIEREALFQLLRDRTALLPQLLAGAFDLVGAPRPPAAPLPASVTTSATYPTGEGALAIVTSRSGCDRTRQASGQRSTRCSASTIPS